MIPTQFPKQQPVLMLQSSQVWLSSVAMIYGIDIQITLMYGVAIKCMSPFMLFDYIALDETVKLHVWNNFIFMF